MIDARKISDGVVAWTGFGKTPWPSRDEERLVQRFGADSAAELLPVLRSLEQEFYESDAHAKAPDLADMGHLAAERFRGQHPELSSRAVEALAWCYTFDLK